MTKRSEFSAKTRKQAYARSKGLCENKACGLPLQVGHFAYDHILPDALGGKPELSNCQVICDACHSAKTGKKDIPQIRKADRQRARHVGATVSRGPEIKSAGRCRICQKDIRHQYDLRRRGPARGPTVGERNPNAKLTAEIVASIRASEEQSIILADRFGVHKATINKFRAGSRWNAPRKALEKTEHGK